MAVGTLCPAPPRQLAAPPPPSHCCPRPRASATLDPGPCHPSHLTLLWGWHREEAELGPGWCHTPQNRRESETSGALPEPVALGGCLSGAGQSHCQLGSSEVRHRGYAEKGPVWTLSTHPRLRGGTAGAAYRLHGAGRSPALQGTGPGISAVCTLGGLGRSPIPPQAQEYLLPLPGLSPLLAPTLILGQAGELSQLSGVCASFGQH